MFICIILGTLLYITAPLFPKIYNTTEEVRTLATRFLRVTAIVMPIQGFLHATYFTIRSGGKTFITFLFDSVFLWVVTVPVAFLLIYKTGVTIFLAFFLVVCSHFAHEHDCGNRILFSVVISYHAAIAFLVAKLAVIFA